MSIDANLAGDFIWGSQYGRQLLLLEKRPFICGNGWSPVSHKTHKIGGKNSHLELEDLNSGSTSPPNQLCDIQARHILLLTPPPICSLKGGEGGTQQGIAFLLAAIMTCKFYRPGLANIFWKGPKSKYFRLCRPTVSFTTAQLSSVVVARKHL